MRNQGLIIFLKARDAQKTVFRYFSYQCFNNTNFSKQIRIRQHLRGNKWFWCLNILLQRKKTKTKMPSLVKKWQSIQRELDEEENSSSSDEDREVMSQKRIEEWKQQQLIRYVEACMMHLSPNRMHPKILWFSSVFPNFINKNGGCFCV